MKRISILALAFVLVACLTTGCRGNNMNGTSGTENSTGNTTITPSTDDTRVPDASARNRGSTITDPIDGILGGDDSMPRSPIPGMGR